MLIVICGPSGSGKSTLAKELQKVLSKNEDAAEVVMTTTRAPREGEKDGIDYHFLSVEEFQNLIDRDALVYYEEYSGQRFYGVTKDTVREYLKNSDKTGILVTTPGGLRQVNKMFTTDKEAMNCMSYYVECSLGERVKRYIDRIGADKFSFDDMNEIFARVNRDFGMFLGIEKEVDKIISNNEKSDKFLCIGEMLRDHKEKKTYLNQLEDREDQSYPELN